MAKATAASDGNKVGKRAPSMKGRNKQKAVGKSSEQSNQTTGKAPCVVATVPEYVGDDYLSSILIVLTCTVFGAEGYTHS